MTESVREIEINTIVVPEGRRPINRNALKPIKESIEEIGLRTPITVREEDSKHVLVAGRHRVEACRQLGLTRIAAIVMTDMTADPQLWEIAENLHRADLTTLQRAELVAKWKRLVGDEQKPAQAGPVSGGRGNKGGQRQAARKLGVSRQEVQRSQEIASITPEAKEAAKAAGLDDNQSKLLEVAKEPPARQVEKVAELLAHKSSGARKPHAESAEQAPAGPSPIDPIEVPAPDDIEAMKEEWAAERKKLRKALKKQKDKRDRAEAVATDAKVQVAELRQERDALRHELELARGPGIEDDIDPENYFTAFMLRAEQAAQFGVYSGPPRVDVVEAAGSVASVWSKLADEINQKLESHTEAQPAPSSCAA